MAGFKKVAWLSADFSSSQATAGDFTSTLM
jgi:hypothetical protein